MGDCDGTAEEKKWECRVDQLERLREKAVLLRKEKFVYRTPFHPDRGRSPTR